MAILYRRNLAGNNFVNPPVFFIFVLHFGCFMTENDEKLLADFEIRMKQLMYLCDTLKDENIQLRQELTRKVSEIESLTTEVNQLKTKYDNLKFVKSFSSENQEEVEQAKKRLSKLVQDVDKCIAMLKI